MILFWQIVYWVAAGILFYALFGYAVILLIVSRLRTPKPVAANHEGSVTLVIPAHNEEKVLEAKLKNAIGLDFPKENLEIFVASDGSIDGTNRIAGSFANEGVKLLAFENRRGKASVLNDAAAAATGDVICLCDANVMFQPDALQILVQRLGDPELGAVSGDVRLASDEANFGEGESLYYKIEKRLQVAESSIGSLMGVDGGMYLVRKHLFEPLPADTILDDFVISMRVIRAGYRVAYEPAAVADENGTPLAVQEYRRRVRVSAGAVQALKRGEYPPLSRPIELWQFISHKLLRWLGPWWLLMILIANIMLWRVHVFYQVTLAIQIAGYLIALAGLVSLRFRATRLGGIVFYFVLSHVAMMVGTIKGLFNRQQVTWQQADRTGKLPTSHTSAAK